MKAVDGATSTIRLSRRFPESDPWLQEHLPSKGDRVEAQVAGFAGGNCIARCTNGIEVLIPEDEISWNILLPTERQAIAGTRQEVLVTDVLEDERAILGSIRQLGKNPWKEIARKLPRGTSLRATVTSVTRDFVRVQLPGSLKGIIPKEAMYEAGYEYADFITCVVPGQGIDVVVSKVKVHKRRIHVVPKRVADGR